MQYIEVTINDIEDEQQDILVALLSEMGYEGFVQSPDSLQAYIAEELYNAEGLKEIAGAYTYNIQTIAKQNWNALWEESFQPVVVEGFCTIRADFHQLAVDTPYEIIITPKMSFGTGHHATTQLVMQIMGQTEMGGKTVFDFGTGTGVLAILAEKLGADSILGIDNDEWSVENALENVQRNNCTRITIEQNNTDTLPAIQADIILANINRHILLQYMDQLYNSTKMGGTILMSGLLTTDKDIITDAASATGFTPLAYKELNGWIALAFNK